MTNDFSSAAFVGMQDINCFVSVFGPDNNNKAYAHVKNTEHFLMVDLALFLYNLEDVRYVPCARFKNSALMLAAAD